MKSPMKVIDEMMYERRFDSNARAAIALGVVVFIPFILAMSLLWFVWEFVRITFAKEKR